MEWVFWTKAENSGGAKELNKWHHALFAKMIQFRGVLPPKTHPGTPLLNNFVFPCTANNIELKASRHSAQQ